MAKARLRSIIAAKVASMVPEAESIQLSAATARPASDEYDKTKLRKIAKRGDAHYKAGNMKGVAKSLSDFNDSLERYLKRIDQR